MKQTLLNKKDIELLNHLIFRNRMIGARIFTPFLIINILIIILIVNRFPDNDIAIIWGSVILIVLVVLMTVSIKLINRNIRKDRDEKKAKYVIGKVTRLDDREKVKVVSRIATKIPNKVECIVEIDNDKVYEIESEVYKELKIGDEALLKFGKYSDKYLSLTKN